MHFHVSDASHLTGITCAFLFSADVTADSAAIFPLLHPLTPSRSTILHCLHEKGGARSRIQACAQRLQQSAHSTATPRLAVAAPAGTAAVPLAGWALVKRRG